MPLKSQVVLFFLTMTEAALARGVNCEDVHSHEDCVAGGLGFFKGFITFALLACAIFIIFTNSGLRKFILLTSVILTTTGVTIFLLREHLGKEGLFVVAVVAFYVYFKNEKYFLDKFSTKGKDQEGE